MAYRRYNTRRRAIKRRVKRAIKRYRKRVARSRIPRAVTTQANIPRIQHLRYGTFENLNGTAGAIARRVYRANSVYDPQYAVGGTMCMRHKEMSAFYADYVVLGSKITVRQMGSQATSEPAAVLWIYLDDNPTTGALNYFQDIENGKCSYALTNETGTKKQTILSRKFSAKKWFNVSNVKDNVSRIGANCNSNPADEAYFVVNYQAIDATTTADTNVMVIIDYIVMYSQPIDLSL